jgi:hypothetical protein
MVWTFAILCFGVGLRFLLGGAGALIPGFAKERAKLSQVGALLREIEETQAAGLVPTPERWSALRAMPAPWGELAYESLQELRSCGGALLPTLKRLRTLALDNDAALAEARARSAQALAQALVCSLLVPAFGSALYWLLPGLEARATAWVLACVLAVAIAGTGSLWMLAIADRARWAGLPVEARPWMLASQCAGERFLALVRSGNPADLAWVRACELLRRDASGLAERWGASVWGAGRPAGAPARLSLRQASGAMKALEEAGTSLRKAVQVSLMEGRPCADRIETALTCLQQELRSQVERELGLLGTRALKPLFLCVAPALFMLLIFGFWLSWEQAGAGGSLGF